MSDFGEKRVVGIEQPITLRKIYFGIVCAFTSLIVLLIFDLNNYETWFAIPMGALLVAYYFILMLNTVNVYKSAESIIIEHPIKGELVFNKHELVNVKTALLHSKLIFSNDTFYFSYSTGLKILWLTLDEGKVEREIKELLLR